MIWLILLLSPIVFSIPTVLAWYLRKSNLSYSAVIGLFISLLASVQIYRMPEGFYTIEWLPSLGISFVFVVDYLSRLMGILTTFIAFLIGLYSLEYMKHDYRLGWYWFFFNTFTASMLLVVYSDNLFGLLIGWEGLGLASWALIGHWFRDDDELSYVGVIGRKVWKLKMFWSPSFAGWRAISTIRIGDMPMFFAIAVIFALAGNLNISAIHWHHIFAKLGLVGATALMLMLLMGPFTKSAQLPFSEWLMTAMTGPTTVSALLHSATMVAAGAYLFMRLSWYIEPWHVHELETAYAFILVLGLASSLYGAVVALGCRERKVLLASSTLSSLGIMFAITALSYWVGKIAIIVAFWYLIVHALAKATLFLVAGHLIHATHDRFLCGDIDLAKRLKLAFVATIVATLCLSGIPPFTAYWVKSEMDELIHHITHEFGLAPLVTFVIIALAYSAFLAKFLSLNFLKGRRVELHLHREILMPSAYILMCATLIPLAFVVASKYGKAGAETTSIAVGLLVSIAYVVALIKPTHESRLGAVLGDRLYLMALNDLIVPKVGWFLAKLSYYFDKAIDLFSHYVMPEMFEELSKAVRRIQTGILTDYLKVVIGFVFAMMLIAGWFEWRF
ncbi:NADH-quinone oxidoreductase subunit 5 family protein [Archaeoglobus sp.]